MYSVLYLSGTFDFTLPFIFKIIVLSGGAVIWIFFYRTNTLGAYLITPAMGSNFVMYLAKMQGSVVELYIICKSFLFF